MSAKLWTQFEHDPFYQDPGRESKSDATLYYK